MKPGDSVRYRAAFLRSCGIYTGPIPFARGEVVAVVGPLVEVEWNDPDIPRRILAANLEPCRKAGAR